MKQKIAKIIQENDNFVIASHVGPDGDSLGSTIGLGLILKKLGKKYCLAFGETETELPPQYRFLPEIKQIQSYKQCFKPDVFFILECPTAKRLGGSNKLLEKARISINIDHHADNHQYGDLNWVEPETSSTAQMIFELNKSLGVELDKDIATNLYAGLVTDTGRFQYSNTNTSAFEMASDLLSYGVNFKRLFEEVYENRSFRSTILLGEILAKATLIRPLKLIYSTVTLEDFLLSGAKVGEIEHFIDNLRGVHGVDMAVIFKEVAPNDIKVSLRSKGKVNVAKIAEKFGGGGHASAAGYTMNTNLKDAIKELCSHLEAKCNKTVVSG